MTRSEIEAYNAGISAVVDIAVLCAAVMRSREVKAPTRIPFATEALEALAETARELMLPAPPDGPEPVAGVLPRPKAPPPPPAGAEVA